MARKLVVLDVVGLTPGLLGEATPNLSRLAAEGFQAEVRGILPALTCSSQATILTGRLPRDHGIVGNGWYFRELSEVWLWRQSNRLVEGPKIWERLRAGRPGFTCAKLFWWYNMYSTADFSVTPRPVYHADGRKQSSIYTEPAELKAQLDRHLGTFPLVDFWGPGAGIRSSEWIAACARHVISNHDPDLTLVYLPHLDYDFQRYGPGGPRSARSLLEIDRVAGELILFARERDRDVLVLSEYGITPVAGSVSINRVLRREGFLRVQETPAGELLDAGASRAFAVSDHQVAHVYVQRSSDLSAVKDLLSRVAGVEEVLDADGKAEHGLDHSRAGDLVAVAGRDRWFDYYYWLDDDRAPDFARTVDIHRKPGYDPAELFLDPAQPLVKLRVLWKLALRGLGFRHLMNVIPLDSSLVGGSHGRLADSPRDGPVLIGSTRTVETSSLAMTDIGTLMEEILGGS